LILKNFSRPGLRKGSRVAVVSPASAAKTELVMAGVERLRAFGYDPVVMPHALSRGPLYYAGTAPERVADLHAAFADETVEGVICTRGGWGSAELLPLLDAELVKANPKCFVGYSDHTSLHTWFWNECGMATVYGPMVAADWAKLEGVDERTWRAAVESDGAWNVGDADGMRVLRDGEAEGRLLGGCLSILAEGLGTPWALRMEEPAILFVEDIGTKPYQWDRMLQHLDFAGLMENVRGVVIGDMSANVEEKDVGMVEAACMHGLRDFPGPVMMGLKCGHVAENNRSLRLGAWVRMGSGRVSE
jgi:muramoyltetrapeptide carboxypeptidase